MKNRYINFAIAIVFIWIGFVCSISFMEAWLKFRAPGVTTEIGLGVGQLVFTALNRVEITCAILIILSLVFSKSGNVFALFRIYFFITLIILSVQTFWLLPILHQRADLRIEGLDVPRSNVHLWYVMIEIIKVITLFIYGVKLLNAIIGSKNKIHIQT
ncbi:hypothetical protein [Aquimarina sp. AU474]|uniref:hypothetical protein n=1 Tax=Aquimarina sp. AU474 TaxID=2108529 RepID=UPI000D68BBE9|nr:hypothetical protein [Aquimarina sp. AU474]